MTVFTFTEKEAGGKLHDGVVVEMNADVRDLDDHFVAHLLPNGHQILISLPGQSAQYRNDYALVEAWERKRGTHCDRVHQSRNVARNAVQLDQNRTSKHLLLNFPKYMELSNIIYSPDSVDGDITMKLITYKYNFSPDVFSYATRATWKLHTIKEDRVVTTPTIRRRTNADELAESMAGMDI